MTSKSVALILGAGPRVGASVAGALASRGYSIAIASRSGSNSKNEDGYLSLKADFTKPESIPPLFDAVKTEFDALPRVVVYNAPGFTVPPEENSPLSVPSETFALDLNVNTVSPYVAAQQALIGWDSLPEDTKKTFIYTGNMLNEIIPPTPMFMTLGVGKSASAFWIAMADMLYSSRNIRFFYPTQRTEDGGPIKLDLDGPANGEFYAQLIDHEGNIPWSASFVKGKGYVKFK